MAYKVVRWGESLFRTFNEKGDPMTMTEKIRFIRICTDSRLSAFLQRGFNSDLSIMMPWYETNMKNEEQSVVLVLLGKNLMICGKERDGHYKVLNYMYKEGLEAKFKYPIPKANQDAIDFLVKHFNLFANDGPDPVTAPILTAPNPPPKPSALNPPPKPVITEDEDEVEIIIEEKNVDPLVINLSGIKYFFVAVLLIALCLMPMHHVAFKVNITYEGCGLALALLVFQIIQINIFKDDKNWADMKPSHIMAGVFIYLVLLFCIRLALEMSGYTTNPWFGIQFIAVHSVFEYVGLVQGPLGLINEVTWNRIVRV